MHQAFRNIVTMLHAVRDGLLRDTNNYQAQEQASQQIPSGCKSCLRNTFTHQEDFGDER